MPPIRHGLIRTLILAMLTLGIAAASEGPAPAPAPAPSEPLDLPGSWSSSGRAGFFLTSVYADGEASSRDGAIGSASDSTAYLLSLDTALLWRDGDNAVDHQLRLRYGRIRTQGARWLENNDEVAYAGVFRHTLARPHFVYAAVGADTVFTSPVDRRPFDPLSVRASVGYGQLYEGLLLHAAHDAKDLAGEDRLELRLGVRGQKRWSRFDSREQDEVEVGPEGFARYDRPIDDTIRYFIQYEVFSEFDDIAHLSHLITAGLTASLGRYLTLELDFRAYYESHPHELPAGSPGYDRWSSRQDTLIGLTYAW